VFACALLNSQPMGFYAPAQIVRDAKEHGVAVRPPDINFSGWDCTLEPPEEILPSSPGLTRGSEDLAEIAGPSLATTPQNGRALRLGLRQVKGLSEADAARLVGARGAGYRDAPDLWRRSGLGRAALERLAAADAMRSLGLDRRRGLWAVKALSDAPLPLFAAAAANDPSSCPDLPCRSGGGAGMAGSHPAMTGQEKEEVAAALLPPMPLGEHVVEDYGTLGLTLKRHPLAFLRTELQRQRLVTAADLAHLPIARRVAIAGLVLIRQRPGSANGVVFITLEDETGIANLIVWPAVLERLRRAALGATLLYCRGRLQREESVIHIVAEDLQDWSARLATLRERGGAPLPGLASSAAPRPFGRAAHDLVIASRDFR
jgi:error-prone DNA polymerase